MVNVGNLAEVGSALADEASKKSGLGMKGGVSTAGCGVIAYC